MSLRELEDTSSASSYSHTSTASTAPTTLTFGVPTPVTLRSYIITLSRAKETIEIDRVAYVDRVAVSLIGFFGRNGLILAVPADRVVRIEYSGPDEP